MSTRTVRLDEETEDLLQHIVRVTGMSMSAAFKKGLWLLYQELAPPSHHTPYDIYKTLDLGPGGYARAPSTDVQRGVREALYQKFRR